MIAYVMWYARRVKREPGDQPRPRPRPASARRSRGARRRPTTAGTCATSRRCPLFVASMVLLVVGVLQVEVVHRPDRRAVPRDGHRARLRRRAGAEPRRAARSSPAPRTWWAWCSSSPAPARCWSSRRRRRSSTRSSTARRGTLSALPRGVIAQVMFLIQCVINFFIHSGHRAGGADDADHGAAGRPGRHHAPDGGLRLPALRVHQPDPADQRRDDGRARRGEDPVGALGAVVPAADADPRRAELPAAHPAGAVLCLEPKDGCRGTFRCCFGWLEPPATRREAEAPPCNCEEAIMRSSESS